MHIKINGQTVEVSSQTANEMIQHGHAEPATEADVQQADREAEAQEADE